VACHVTEGGQGVAKSNFLNSLPLEPIQSIASIEVYPAAKRGAIGTIGMIDSNTSVGSHITQFLGIVESP
jgi:hypothetical protein